jgi:quercetin dioxygenase-like cupin family protein
MQTYKASVEDVEFAPGLDPNEGWIEMKVQFLVDKISAGAQEMVIGRTVFEPGSRHELHRHENAEEFQYLLSGEGVVLNGDEEVQVKPGEIVFTPAGEWHGFRNASDTEDAVLLWGWCGAGDRDTAGYEVKEGQ